MENRMTLVYKITYQTNFQEYTQGFVEAELFFRDKCPILWSERARPTVQHHCSIFPHWVTEVNHVVDLLYSVPHADANPLTLHCYSKKSARIGWDKKHTQKKETVNTCHRKRELTSDQQQFKRISGKQTEQNTSNQTEMFRCVTIMSEPETKTSKLSW